MIRIFCMLVVAGLCSCGMASPPRALRPGLAQAMIEKGAGALRSGDLNGAAASFRVAYELGAEAGALDGFGCVAFFRGTYEEAERMFKAARDRDPSYPNAVANLAQLYDLLGEERRASSLYLQAIREDPANARARNNYGVFLIKAGELDAGRRFLAEAESLDAAPLTRANIEKVGGEIR